MQFSDMGYFCLIMTFSQFNPEGGVKEQLPIKVGKHAILWYSNSFIEGLKIDFYIKII